MFQRISREWNTRRFAQVANRVVHTEPLITRGSGPVYVSLLCRKDVFGYLLALKSLYVQIQRGRVVLIDDGSLGPDEHDCLAYHIPGVEIVPLHSIDTQGCPRGGCWERLAKIVELSKDDYVIQIDADTLVVGDIDEVRRSIIANRSFLLGTGSGMAISTAADTARMVRTWIKSSSSHELSFTVEAEASLMRLHHAEQRRYVHASAGFSGFAHGAFTMQDLQWFSSQMTTILGPDRWAQWGSEQIASNFLLANAPLAEVLPYPRYACFEPHLASGERAFLHFIGTHRYQRGEYRRHAAQALVNLRGAARGAASAAVQGSKTIASSSTPAHYDR